MRHFADIQRESVSRARTASPVDELVSFLELLAGGERAGLVELRFRRPGGPMRQRFHAAGRLERAAETALWLARRHDVYVGCAPRLRRAGARAAIAPPRLLWVDCDSGEAARRLDAFEPAAAIVVRSGSGDNRHGYWALERPVDGDEAERLNRRLAYALGADGGAVTGAAAILRPLSVAPGPAGRVSPARSLDDTSASGERR